MNNFLKSLFISWMNPFLKVIKAKFDAIPNIDILATKEELVPLATKTQIESLVSSLHAIATSGNYNDLDNLPNLNQYAKAINLATVATSGKFNDLVDKPTMSLYVLRTALSAIALSGEYADLKNKPDLSIYQLASALHLVATSGDYADLKNKPNLAVYQLASDLHLISSTGEYADLKNKPDLSIYQLATELHNIAKSGEYADLKNKPDLSIYQVATALHNIAISGEYADLKNKPDLSQFVLNSKIGANNGVVPLNSSGKIDAQYINLSALTPKGVWNASTNTPNLANGTGSNGDFYLIQIAGEQDLGAGNTIYDEGDALVYFADLGTWERVGRTDSVNSVNGKQGAIILNTDDIAEGDKLYFTSERAVNAQLQPDWNAIEGKSQIKNKPTLHAVATSGNYNDLTNKPDLNLKANKATTLDGYGITDAVNSSEVVNMAQAGKILRLNSQAELPAVSSASYKFKTARKIKIQGKVSGEVSFDGTDDAIIEVNNEKLIEKTADGKYPALDGSLIKNIVPLIPEFSEDPIGLSDGQMYVINTILFPEGEYQGVGMIGWSEELNQLRIKLSNGTKQIKLENIF